MANALDAVLQMRREKLAREQAQAEAVSNGIQGGIDNFLNVRKFQENSRTNRLNTIIAQNKLEQGEKELSQADRRLDLAERETVVKEKKLEKTDVFEQFQKASKVAEFTKLTGNAQLFAQASALGNSLVDPSNTDPNEFIASAERASQEQSQTQGASGTSSSTITGISPDQKDVFGDQSNQSKAQQEIEKQVIAQREKERDKEIQGADKGISGSVRFLEQFERSHKEISKDFPEFGRVGASGKFERLLIGGLTALDEYPETKTLITEAKPIANQSARDVEGGRITDQDRQIYADALANTIARPSSTNVRLTSNALLRMVDKGGDITPVISAFSNSEVDVMQSIVKQVLEGLTDEQLSKLGDV